MVVNAVLFDIRSIQRTWTCITPDCSQATMTAGCGEVSERDMKEFIDSFAEYRGKNRSEGTAAQLTKALDELAELLGCTGKNDPEWLQKTSMMQIGKGNKRFINRIALLDAISFAKGRLK